MRRAVFALAAAASLAACSGDPRSAENVVARAGPTVLTVARLAELAASAGEQLPVRADVVEALAMRWVEYSLLGLRAAAGDRLGDRETILAVAWPDVRAAVIDSFRTVRLAGRVQVTPAQVDSAYQSAGVRFLRQVLKHAPPSMPARQRDSVRALAVRIRAGLAAGGSWQEANEQNDDPRSRLQGGALGLVVRGQTVPAFERAGFALAPGQLSGIVETEYGYHVIYRPRLDEVRDEFAASLRELFAVPLDSAYEAGLLAQKHGQLVPGAAAAVVYTAAWPLRAKGMGRVLATYDGGRFTVRDLALWLQYLPSGFQQQVQGAPEHQLLDLLGSLVVRELAWRDAEAAGTTLPAERYQRIETAFRLQVDQILRRMGLDPDSLAAEASSHRGRQQEAARRVDRYLDAAVRDPRLGEPLPAGLATRLLDTGEWEVSPGGVDRVVLEIGMIRAARSDSAATARGPAGATPPAPR